MKISFEIHPLVYVSLLIAFLTGYFKDVILFMAIIFIHELGHVLAAFLFKWQLEKIIFFPFGGITVFNVLINKPLFQEMVITIMGPLFQVIFTFIINNPIITFYSKIILIINLMPIYPLDGSKLLNIFLNKIFSFKLSYLLTIYISYFTGFIFLIIVFIQKELICFLTILLLIIKLEEELKKHNFIFNKFLYERYLYNLKFNKIKVVSKLEDFKKDYYHYLKIKDLIVEEKNYLNQKYS